MYLNDLSEILEELKRSADKAYYRYDSGSDEEATAKATSDIAGFLKEAVDDRLSKQRYDTIPKILKT